MARWTDTTTYPNLAVPAAADLLLIADASAAAGSQQRTITWSQLTTVQSILIVASDETTALTTGTA